MFELTRIKGATVKLNSIPIKDMIQSEENWKIQSATVSALRLDVVLKDMIRKSRNIAKQLIEKKRVKVNHTIVDTPDFQLERRMIYFLSKDLVEPKSQKLVEELKR